MNDGILGFLALTYAAFGIVDLYVAYRLVRAAWPTPRIPTLTAAAVCMTCVMIGGEIGALLGIDAVLFRLSARHLLDPGFTLFLLAFALGIPSGGGVYMLLALIRWSRAHRAAHRHKREGDRRVQYHRRATDPPEDSPPSI